MPEVRRSVLHIPTSALAVFLTPGLEDVTKWEGEGGSHSREVPSLDRIVCSPVGGGTGPTL